MKTFKLALDIGNSAVKGSVLDEKNRLIKNILIPSAINTIDDERYLHFDEVAKHFIEVIDSPLQHPEGIIAVGNAAMDLPSYQQYDVGATSHKANHEITSSLLFGIIAEMIQQDDEEVDILLGVSIPIVESKTLDLASNYQDLLLGSHKIKVFYENESKELKINIRSAQVLNEGQAGFLGLLDTVDEGFRQTMVDMFTDLGEDEDAVNSFEDFLVVDIGEGTTDLAVFRNKRFNPEYSYSITKGYGNLLEQAMTKAEREGITVESRKQLQSLLLTTNRRRQSQKEMWEGYLEVEKTDYIDELVQTILKAYGRQSYFDAIIFLGGGFSALTGYHIAKGPKIEMDDTLLFDELEDLLKRNKKVVDLTFGIPEPFSQSINNRGLMQILTTQHVE